MNEQAIWARGLFWGSKAAKIYVVEQIVNFFFFFFFTRSSFHFMSVPVIASDKWVDSLLPEKLAHVHN